MNNENLKIVSKDWNEYLEGYVCELNDGSTIQVQFELETNRLNADFNTFFPVLDTQNEYGLKEDEEYRDAVRDLISNDKDFLETARELDEKNNE